MVSGGLSLFGISEYNKRIASLNQLAERGLPWRKPQPRSDAVVMDARGIYAAKDAAKHREFRQKA